MYFIIFLLSLCFCFCEKKLIQLQVLSRHCDRTSVQSSLIPSCPIDLDKKFNLLSGSLTPLGEYQCYNLGKYIRETYIESGSPLKIDGISELWNPIDYQFTADFIPRTVRSAWSISKAMFPVGHKIDIPPYDFSLPGGSQSVPIIIPKELQNDRVFLETNICPLLETRYEDFLKSSEGKALIERYNELFMKEINSVCGYNSSFSYYSPTSSSKRKKKQIGQPSSSSPLTFPEIGIIFDLSTCLLDHQILCSNIQKIYNEKIYSGFNEYLRIKSDFNRTLHEGKSMISGGFLNALFSYAPLSSSSSSKYVHYSGHDSTILYVLTGLQVFVDYPELLIQPNWGSSVYFEIYQDDTNSKKYIQMKYKNGWNGEVKTIHLKSLGCPKEDSFCDFDVFQQKVNEKIVLDNKEFCEYCENDFSDFCIQ